MSILAVENTGSTTLELEVRDREGSNTVYVAPGDVQTLEQGRQISFSSIESGVSRFTLKLPKGPLRLDVYRIGASATRRNRSVSAGTSRRIRLAPSETLLTLPVGLF